MLNDLKEINHIVLFVTVEFSYNIGNFYTGILIYTPLVYPTAVIPST